MPLLTRWVPDEGPPPVWVDFNKWGATVVSLELPGTRSDLQRIGIELAEGMVLNVWDADSNDDDERDDLIATGIVQLDPERGWVLRVTRLSHESDPPPAEGPNEAAE